MKNIPLCDFSSPLYLIISENVPSLVYYSHIPALIASLFVCAFVLLYFRNKLVGKVFFFVILVFGLWSLFSLINWASNRSDLVMFIWSVIILIEPLIHIGSLYLLHVIYNKTDVTLQTKIYWSLLYIPLVLMAPTSYLLKGFDTINCFPVENVTSHYSYVLEIFFIILIIIFSIRTYRFSKYSQHKKKILILSSGIILFLSIFTVGNLIGSFIGNWNLAQMSLFSIHILIGSLVYLVVKYRIFHIKLNGVEVIIGSISLMILALLLVRHLYIFQRILIFITFIFCLVLGYFLIQSVKRESTLNEMLAKQRDELKHANKKLEELNELKSEFISLATHHLGTPLTAIKGYVSLIQESDEELSEKSTILNTIQLLTNNVVMVIRDFIDVHKIDEQDEEYYYEDVNVKDILDEIVNECKPIIEMRNNKVGYVVDEREEYLVYADAEKIRRAILNIIENSTKYTTDGFVKIQLSSSSDKFCITISDKGVRNLPHISPKLMEKFSKSGNKEEANIIGQGLGLYVTKHIIETHQGSFRIEFKEEGKGVVFRVELPKIILN